MATENNPMSEFLLKLFHRPSYLLRRFEEGKVRRELADIALIWTYLFALLVITEVVLARVFRHPDPGAFALIVFVLGIVVCLWVLSNRRFDFGDPLERALVLVQRMLSDLDAELDDELYVRRDDPELETFRKQRKALRAAFSQLRTCALEDATRSELRSKIESGELGPHWKSG